MTTSIEASLPHRTTKTKWAFNKAKWPAFEAECEKMAKIPVQNLSVEALAGKVAGVITDASRNWVP